MRKNLNVIAAYSIMMGLIILVGIFQSWNIALSIFNLCLISAVMTMGANIQSVSYTHLTLPTIYSV